MQDKYRRTRTGSVRLCQRMATEDYVVQSMPDASPTKWHLAHVTWFFELFVLEPFLPGYQRFSDDFHFLFNSYYNSVGAMHPRSQRGLLTRPLLSEVMAFREHVDENMERLFEQELSPDCLARVELGLNHEQQHQELLLTDIKHAFSCNPLQPALFDRISVEESFALPDYGYSEARSGLLQVGHTGETFCFDNELPRHQELLQPFQIGNRLVTNGEYREFIEDGGYSQHVHWLSDGWSTVKAEGWQRPLYWDKGLETEFTLSGRSEIDDKAPVTHVSLYEADAYARWVGARLPAEFEWEVCAADQEPQGNLQESGHFHPVPGRHRQFFGDVWEWTSSAYSGYPGFRPLAGSLGEYNGKFMCNQATVRGGSCVTATDHIRSSYRSFFYPHQRWQFLGIRLARDGQ